MKSIVFYLSTPVLNAHRIDRIGMNLENNDNELEHPNWFYRDLVEDCFPWQQGTKMSFKAFNSKYTLHDSYWIGVFFNVAYERTVTLAIRWDAVWLPDEIQKSTSIVKDYPYLFIQLTDVEQFSTTNYGNDLSSTRTISDCEFEEIQGKNFLAIDDVYGGQISILYQGEETFLAMERNRKILAI